MHDIIKLLRHCKIVHSLKMCKNNKRKSHVTIMKLISFQLLTATVNLTFFLIFVQNKDYMRQIPQYYLAVLNQYGEDGVRVEIAPRIAVVIAWKLRKPST